MAPATAGLQSDGGVGLPTAPRTTPEPPQRPLDHTREGPARSHSTLDSTSEPSHPPNSAPRSLACPSGKTLLGGGVAYYNTGVVTSSRPEIVSGVVRWTAACPRTLPAQRHQQPHCDLRELIRPHPTPRGPDGSLMPGEPSLVGNGPTRRRSARCRWKLRPGWATVRSLTWWRARSRASTRGCGWSMFHGVEGYDEAPVA